MNGLIKNKQEITVVTVSFLCYTIDNPNKYHYNPQNFDFYN